MYYYTVHTATCSYSHYKNITFQSPWFLPPIVKPDAATFDVIYIFIYIVYI